MANEFQTTWRLLKPHARPHVWLFLLVFALGAVTAMQAATLSLIAPVWELVLFPEEAGRDGPAVPETATPAAAGEAEPAASLATHAQSAKDESKERVISFFSACGDRLVRTGWVEQHDMAVLLAVALAAILIGLVTAPAQYAFTWLSRLVSLRMIVDLRVRLARHLMGLSMRYHNERRFGDLLSRVSSDVTTTLAAINNSLKGLLLEPLQGLGYLAVAAYTAPLPTLGVLFLVPLAAYPVSRLTRKVRRRSTKSLTTLGSSVQALTEIFRGIRTVKAFGGEQKELDRYRELNASYERMSMKMVRSIAMTHAWTTFMASAGAGFLVLVVGWASLRFRLFDDAAQMGVFFGAILMVNNNARNFSKSWTRVQESVGAGVRISELLDERVDVVECEDPRPVSASPEVIRLEELTFRYPGGDRNALESLSLEVRRGETLALVGASGAGKTTVVDLVARFIDPVEGRVTVDGVDLRDVSLAQWTARYALVGQSPFLFHSTIGENIRYGKPDATQAEVEAAARAANIHDFIASLPEGYETGVEDMGERLSGGQRQRITIARALLKGAPLLLLDEATSALDSESEAEVQRALDRLMVDRTVIVIAHRLSTVRGATRIAVLDEGRLVELGTHEELLRRGGTYSRLHTLQERGAALPAASE